MRWRLQTSYRTPKGFVFGVGFKVSLFRSQKRLKKTQTMVLSNKKLKQKLRAELAEASAKNLPSNNTDSNRTNPEAPKSLKHLLDSAAHKARLSKREKRRITLNLHNSDGVLNKVAHVEETENGNGKGKKRKREKKPNEDSKKDSGDVNKEGEAFKKKRKNYNNKKKKKNKLKKEEKQSEVANGAKAEQIAPQKVEYNNSQTTEEGAKKVYVGGIPYYSTEDDIRSYFDHCGTITDVDCMMFPESGKFRGIAIISFKTEEAAKRALALDGADMGGLYLKIQPYKSTRTTKTSTSDFSPPAIAGYNRIYVGSLSWDITEDDLKKLFSDCSITAIRFGEDKETGEFKGYAHVDFADQASVTKALKLDQRVVCGRPVRIRCAVPPPNKGQLRKLGASASSTASLETETASENGKIENENNNYSGGVGSGKLRRRICYDCGEKGHISSACPKRQDQEQKNTSVA